MKQRILRFTPEKLIRMLQGKLTQQFNLPIDTELVDIKYDAFVKQVVMVIRSDSFENVAEDVLIPEFTCKSSTISPTLHTSAVPIKHTFDVPLTDTSVTIPVDSVTQQKSLLQTLTASQPSSSTSIGAGVKMLEPKSEVNMDTCGFEGEFTKEQRKLLKFTSGGDFVIVKPIQFLKTEWEDINDTVKSIGGKWVKGGTIDYWSIPKNIKQEE